MSSLVQLEIEYQRLVAQRNALGDRYSAGEKDLLPQIEELNARIRVLVYQIEALMPSNSSGQIILDEQTATDDKSRSIAPDDEPLILKNGRIQPQPDTQTGTNAERNTSPVDFGTDAELRPYIQTQGTAPGASQTSPGVVYRVPGYATVGDNAEGSTAPAPGGEPGVTPPSDDSGVTSSNGAQNVNLQSTGTGNVVTSLNSINWTDEIKPQPNVLYQYASYSYQASLYLIDQANSERILNTGSKDLGNAKLLVQSGGGSQLSRSDFFNLDYYIDNIELHSFFAGKSVRLAHNVKEVKMTIVEPNGISFIQNLESAIQQFTNASTRTYYENDGSSSVSLPEKLNYTSQIYLLVIKFYGYDDQGNLVRGGRQANGTSDPNAFVEKFYPLLITKVNFRIASKAVEYEIHAKAPAYYINASQGRGTVPFNYEFSGGTIKDILAGPSVYSTVQNAVTLGSNAAASARAAFAATDPRRVDLVKTAPAKANAVTPKTKTVRKGLMAALNEYQAELQSRGIIEFKDEYNVEFALDSIADASVILPGLNKSGTSMATPGTAADQKLSSKQSMDPKTQTEAIVPGTQIVQFIDQVLRRSSYVRDQQTQIVNNKTGEVTPGPGTNLKNTAWYRIGFKAVPKLNEYDRKRNDYAYKITYTIFPYKIYQLNSPYFKQPIYNGVHKSYEYWFTGKNTEVLHYEENLNALYYIALTQSNLSGATSSVAGAMNINELLKYNPATASGQATQGGGTDKTLEPAANAADQLYSPSDLKECVLTIVGDPAWLQQGEAFSAIPSGDTYAYRDTLRDGTINFDAQQILFEVAFNAPRDYNTLTGLIQPSADKLNAITQTNQSTQSPTKAQFSRIYIAKECVSNFKQGKFTQTLKGSLMVYYPPGSKEGRPAPQDIQTNTAAKVAAPAVSNAPTVQLPRSSVTNPQPTSALAKGVQQILNPPTQLNDPTLTQLQSSPVYIQARRGGATPQAALDAARAAFAAGTNNYSGTALPGIRYPGQQIVKDQ